MKPEELSWTAALNRIAELEAENKHYREWLGASSVDARVAALEEKLTWAMGLNACIEHERAERLSFELAALKGENALLREAVEAEVLWHDSEDDNPKTTTFDERMDLCHYSEWLAKRAIGRDVPDEYEGIPRIVFRLRTRAEEGGRHE